jgi:hypothetical protein
VETDPVPVPVTVTERSGVALQDLKPDDFRLFDNRVRTGIQHPWRDSDLAPMAGIAVDLTNSTAREGRRQLREALVSRREVKRRALGWLASRHRLYWDGLIVH